MGVDITQNNKDSIIEAMVQQMLNGLEICGGMMESHAKENCPVDQGILRNSIAHLVDPSESRVYVGTHIEYGIYQEYGTGIYATEGQGRKTSWSYQDSKGNWWRTNGNKPHPFLRPSVADHMAEYLPVIQDALSGK